VICPCPFGIDGNSIAYLGSWLHDDGVQLSDYAKKVIYRRAMDCSRGSQLNGDLLYKLNYLPPPSLEDCQKLLCHEYRTREYHRLTPGLLRRVKAPLGPLLEQALHR